MHSYILILILFIAVGMMMQFGVAATTISLTGSCQNNILNSSANVIHFNLFNSGNGEATNLNVFPLINGADITSQNVYIPYLKPGNVSMSFYLDNFSMAGSYVGFFNLKYSQGESTFFSVFPCYYYIKKRSDVKIVILNVSIRNLKKYSEVADISILNFGTNTIKFTIKSFGPVNFNITPKSRHLTIKPGEEVNSTFNIRMTNTASLINATFPIGFFADYMKDGIHYSTQPYTVLFHEKAQNKNENVVIYILLILTAVIVILIIVSIIINSKKRKYKKHSV